MQEIKYSFLPNIGEKNHYLLYGKCPNLGNKIQSKITILNVAGNGRKAVDFGGKLASGESFISFFIEKDDGYGVGVLR